MKHRKKKCAIAGIVLMGILFIGSAIISYAAVNEYRVRHNITINLNGGECDGIYYQSCIDDGEEAGSWYDDLRAGEYLPDRYGVYHNIIDYGAEVPRADDTVSNYYDCVGLTPYVRIGSVSRDGYVFDGWELSRSNGSDEDYGQEGIRVYIGAYTDEDIVINATWRRMEYNLSVEMFYLDSDGEWIRDDAGFSHGTVDVRINGEYDVTDAVGYSESITGDYGYEITINPDENWEVNTDRTGALCGNIETDTTVSVYMQPVTLKAEYDGGIADEKGGAISGIPEDEYFTYGYPHYFVGLRNIPQSDKGLKFKGWSPDRYALGGYVLADDPVISKESLKFYAIWEYIIHFDCNSSSVVEGTMNDMNVQLGVGCKLNPCKYSRRGYRFVGWNTKQDGTGINISDGSMTDMLPEDNGVVTLYAMWEPISYEIRLYGRAPEYSTEIIRAEKNSQWLWNNGYFSKQILYDVELSLPEVSSVYNVTGWTGTAWECDGQIYGECNILNNLTEIQGDIISFYPVWRENKYIVNVDSNGGYETDKKIVTEYEDSIRIPDAPVRPGYSFDSWNTDKSGTGTRFDINDVVSKLTPEDGGNVTIYAQWIKKKRQCLKVASSSYGMSLVNPAARSFSREWFDTLGACSVNNIREIADDDCVQVWIVRKDEIRMK